MKAIFGASALALLLAGFPGTSTAAGPRDRAGVQRQRLAEGAELLALADGRLLAWNDRGSAYIRDPEGSWTDRLELPLAHVWALVPDGPGFLAVGETGEHTKAVILFGAHAEELRRWAPSELGWQLFVEGGRRWYVEPAGLVELLPDGRLGQLEPFPDGPGRRRREPRVLAHDGRRLICYGADRSKQDHALASCRRPGGKPWTFDDPHESPPISCGSWVIAHGRRDEQLTIWSFDGEVVGRRSYPAMSVFACADSDTLVIGAGRLVQVAKLPSLSPVWSFRAARGAVTTAAALKGAVAFGTDASNEVVVVRR